jgi:putative endonuclease
MASVYILYSHTSDLYYIGSTQNLDVRLDYHQVKEFKTSFTSKYSDWQLFFSIDNISNTMARKIEAHIKRMKSRKYLEDIKKYPEIVQKLISKYS